MRPIALIAALFPALAVAASPAPLVGCKAPGPDQPVPLAVGEKMEFEIDSLGATVGTFSMSVLPGRRSTPWVILAKGRTGTFAGNFYPVDATAEAQIGRGFLPQTYVEDSTEKGVRRTLEVAFPAPADKRMPVRSTRDGHRDDHSVAAPADTRDMLSALFMVRGMDLPDGREICIPIYGARRVWALRAKVVGREKIRTLLGDVQAIHIEGVAVRSDYPKMTREVHFWVTDDAARIPVEAFGLVQNKPVRARMVKYDPGRREVAKAPLR